MLLHAKWGALLVITLFHLLPFLDQASKLYLPFHGIFEKHINKAKSDTRRRGYPDTWEELEPSGGVTRETGVKYFLFKAHIDDARRHQCALANFAPNVCSRKNNEYSYSRALKDFLKLE